uniref:Uncharacterized protein n=2 Tax=Oryza TaxID=4527 RepID=A0A0D3HTM4_9ORYZ
MADKLSMAILYIREEGIRARLVNKDMAPWWDPPAVEYTYQQTLKWSIFTSLTWINLSMN